MIEKEALERVMTPQPSTDTDEEVQPPLVDPPAKKKKGLMSLFSQPPVTEMLRILHKRKRILKRKSVITCTLE